jgi:hypothetical protein
MHGESFGSLGLLRKPLYEARKVSIYAIEYAECGVLRAEVRDQRGLGSNSFPPLEPSLAVSKIPLERHDKPPSEKAQFISDRCCQIMAMEFWDF